MGLEHRWSTRKQNCLDAIVLHRPLGPVHAKILDHRLGWRIYFRRTPRIARSGDRGIDLLYAA